MQPEPHPYGHIDRRNRAFLDVERVEQQQVAAMLLQTVANLDDPAVALTLPARNEARLLQARDRPAPPMLLCLGLVIDQAEAVHQQAACASTAQLDRAAHIHFKHPAIAVRLTHEAIVDAGEFACGLGELHLAFKRIAVTRHVDRPAGEVAHRLLPVERRAVDVREEGEHVVLRHRNVEMDFAARLKGVHHMAVEAVPGFEPADVVAGAASFPGKHAEIDGHRRIKAEMRQALFQPLP